MKGVDAASLEACQSCFKDYHTVGFITFSDTFHR